MKEVADTGEDLEQDFLEEERDSSYIAQEGSSEQGSQESIVLPTDEEGEEVKAQKGKKTEKPPIKQTDHRRWQRKFHQKRSTPKNRKGENALTTVKTNAPCAERKSSISNVTCASTQRKKK